MKLRTNIGQIFLTHPRDENFTSVYEEAFSKHGQTVELFVVLEINGGGTELLKVRKAEYEKLAQALVSAFKKTYVAAININQDTFERSLAAINAAISKLASHGKVSWYGKLNVAVATIFQNHLSLSTTGNVMVYLVRKNQFTFLSEGLSEQVSRPVKTFSNFSTGRLLNGDRVVLSTNQLSNHLSLDRLQGFLTEETLGETCQAIIAALQEVKNLGFASFIFEIGPQGGENFLAKTTLLTKTTGGAPLTFGSTKTGMIKILQVVAFYLLSFLRFIWNVVASLFAAIGNVVFTFFRKRPKKYLFGSIGIVLVLLAINIGVAVWNRVARENQIQKISILSETTKKLDEAEAAILYDEKRALSLVTEAEKLLSQVSGREVPPERQSVQDRLQALKNKLNKELHIENPVLLTTFPNIPTDLLHSPDGFLGFNRNSNSLAFFDFRVGETRAILKNQNTSNLILGDFVGTLGYTFLKNDGRFEKLNLLEEKLLSAQGEETKALDLSSGKIQALAVLGEGNLARLYLLDTKQNRILRLRITETGLLSPETWLKTSDVNFEEALDLIVDGSIYVLFPNHVEKYFNGQKQDFDLDPVAPPLSEVVKIFTAADYQLIYILDPEHFRILVYNKQGKLQNQITSPKFHDLSDLFVDEKNQLMYVLAGSELLQITLGK